MKTAQACDAIVTALQAAGVNCLPFMPDTVYPPVAFIRFPRQLIVDDTTRFGLGRPGGCSWRRDLPVTLCVGRESERDLRQRLDQLEQVVVETLEGAPAMQEWQPVVTQLGQPEAWLVGGTACVLEDIVCSVIV